MRGSQNRKRGELVFFFAALNKNEENAQITLLPGFNLTRNKTTIILPDDTRQTTSQLPDAGDSAGLAPTWNFKKHRMFHNF